MKTVIRAKGLSKQFLHPSETHSMRLKGYLAGIFRHSPPPTTTPHSPVTQHWILNDLHFTVSKCEKVGIIGKNGAGKSTLIKLLSRILRPTRGELQIDGRIVTLIEIGAGFLEELTGRENIYLCGGLMGMKRRDIARQLDSITGFAEIESMLDCPIKRYSTGMIARLGFALAIHADADILAVDETLAVGDTAFQKRCLSAIKEWMQRKEGTLIFVSHSKSLIENFCTRALYLKDGKIAFDGDPLRCWDIHEKDLRNP